MSADILDQIDAAVDAAETPPPEPAWCPCGQLIADDGPSFYWCREACQIVWERRRQHGAPELAPEQFRDAADQLHAAMRRSPLPQPCAPAEPEPAAPLATIPDGARITVDGAGYVRRDGRWEPAGMWHDQAAEDGVAYRRWCPACHTRRGFIVTNHPEHGAAQSCAQCGHRWPGRPLLGSVQYRTGPWESARLMLSDGSRSVSHQLSRRDLEACRVPAPEVIDALWTVLERRLCGHNDQDQADQSFRPGGHVARARDWRNLAHWADQADRP